MSEGDGVVMDCQALVVCLDGITLFICEIAIKAPKNDFVYRTVAFCV